MRTYKLRGHKLLNEGRVPYSWMDVTVLARRALGKKRSRPFLHRLLFTGEATARRHMVRHLRAGEDNWVQVHARQVTSSQWRFFCSGPRTVELLQLTNGLREEWDFYSRLKVKKHRKLNRKQTHQKPQAQSQERATKAPRLPRARPTRVLLRKQLDVQFKHTPVLATEAADIAAYVFGLIPARTRFGTVLSKEQIARNWILDMLVKSGNRYAQLTERSFTLRLEPAGKGHLKDLSVFWIACSGGNKNLYYRRLRRRMRDRLFGLALEKQRIRKALVWQDGTIAA